MKCKYLIFNRSAWLTLLLLLLSTGTYTYSESYPSPQSISQKLAQYPIHLTMSMERSGFQVVVPVSYYWATLNAKQIKASVSFAPPETIMGKGLTNVSRLEKFLLSNNQQVAPDAARNLAHIYWEESINEGVNPDVAFTQMCLETGFLRFDGTVDPQQCNYCGLGVTGNGVKGLSFSDPREGVRAHIQHLKAYASTENLNGELVDQRFAYVKRGSAEVISELTGKWATDKHYDTKIRSLLRRLYQTN